MELHERLAWAREQAGYKSAADAARALGIPYPTYGGHENGAKGGFRVDDGLRYSKKFKVDFLWLMTGEGAPKKLKTAPLVGYVGAGQRVFPEDPGPGGRLDTIPAPPEAPADCVAVSIRGDSMYPLEDGWVLFYKRLQEGVPDDCINKLCVVQIHDGAALVKKLRRGTKPKLWTLQSWNAEPEEDVRLDWAARVLDIRPR